MNTCSVGAQSIIYIAQERAQRPVMFFLFQDYSESGHVLIGALNAGSNITGVLTDTDSFSALLHRYGALAFWDYAAVGGWVYTSATSHS